MEPLKNLAGRVPEIFNEILQYVPHGDVPALLRTCKALQPACYRHLWSTLVFGDRYRGRYSGGKIQLYWDQPWCPAYGIERHGFSRLLSFIQNQNIEDLGFRHTRALWLNPSIFDNFQAQNVCDILEDIFDNRLDLRHLTISMDVEDPNLNTEQSPHTFLILRDVKRYVESMSERNLSLKIQMYGLNTTLMSKYFCLPMIKEFALYVDYRLWGTSAVDSGLTHISTLGLKIDQLTAALAGMACLQKFFWNASFSTNYYAKRLPEISEIAPQLVKLQKIFLTLRHLRSFIIEGFIFHPHFFLRPPGSLKELRILGSMGFSWWQQFAKCSLVGLENLFIHGELEVPQFTYQPQVDFTMPADIPLQNSFCLGSVSVHGLRKFKIFGLCDLPTDFEDCIVRNNPSLDEESIQHIWLRQGAPIASTCCRRVEGRALAAARTLWSSLPSQFTGSEAGDSLKSQATQEYTRLFISSSDKIHGNEEETENAWKDIEDRVQRELMGRVNLCTKYVSNRYMHRYPNPESATQLEDQFLNDCLKTMGELSGVENWLSAERHIKEVAHVSLTRMRNQIKKVGPKWADIFGKALRQDQKVDIEGTIDDWVPKLVEMYEEDKEEKDLRLERLLDIQTEPHCRGTHTGALDSLLSGWTSG